MYHQWWVLCIPYDHLTPVHICYVQQFDINQCSDWLSDTPSKTATGTIAIQVEDFNDHCPKLIHTTPTMCIEDNVIYATAIDEDAFPNSAPFEFTVIPGNSKGKWTVEHLNGKVVWWRTLTFGKFLMNQWLMCFHPMCSSKFILK